MNSINDIVLGVQETYVPKVRITNADNKPKRKFVAPVTLIDKIRVKRKAFKTYKKYPSMTNYNVYVRARNQVNWQVKKS